MNKELALRGGKKNIPYQFKKYNPIGIEETEAVRKVMESGVLSNYLGAWHQDFYGGPKVREFEQNCKWHFGANNAITVNSWSSGLIAAVGAIGIEPGDEIIVPPWTMCASATAILQWNGIPVFADIEPETFNISPQSVEANITAKTKAIMAVDIFGHSADVDSLMAIAKKHNLKLISDSAQSPGAIYKGKYAGTMSHIGGYSLNYHKHIHTGEGGILVTDDNALAEKMRLIRNHAEAVVREKGETDLVNMLGYNFRLGEIECAIGIEQLKKLKELVKLTQKKAAKLTEGIFNLPGLRVPITKPDCTHVYYIYAMTIDEKKLGVSRDHIVAALQAEGVPVIGRYQNLHLLPMFQNKIAYGSAGFPWTAEFARKGIDYRKGICPIAEDLNDHCFIGLGMTVFDYSEKDLDLIIESFHKVWASFS